MDNLNDQLVRIIELGIERCGSAAALSRATGISGANISRWVNRQQIPKLGQIVPLMEMLGVSFTIPEKEPSPSKDVHFVSTFMSPASDGFQLPPPDNYIAIPTIDEIQARPGAISPIDIRYYFIVLKSLPTIRYKLDLIAVIKDKSTNSQLPLIRGGDIVIVDRDDCQPQNGDFMLVCYPSARGLLGAHGAICRVKDDGDTLIYYSDDKTCAPSVFSIDKDYGGDPRKAILGKVLFCWSDMLGK